MYGYYCIFNDSEPAHAHHPTEQIMKNAKRLLSSQCFWPAHAPHSTTQIMKNVQYLCIFNDSEPAHAPHSTKQIMKNARIPFYLQ